MKGHLRFDLKVTLCFVTKGNFCNLVILQLKRKKKKKNYNLFIIIIIITLQSYNSYLLKPYMCVRFSAPNFKKGGRRYGEVIEVTL
jgi:hypothetical protein